MKKIVIGIDVSKEKIDVTAISAENMSLGMSELGYSQFENRKMGFLRMVAWAKKLSHATTLDDLLFCCETTGSYDHALCTYLYLKGIDIWRENALQIKLSSGVRKGKSDKADSKTIAEYAARHMDKMKLYEPLPENLLSLKHLFLFRRRTERLRTSEKVRATELLRTAGNDESVRFEYRISMSRIKQYDEDLKSIEKRILEIIKSDERLKRVYLCITSIKGVGLVNATALMVYTNCFEYFSTARQVASYWGVAAFREQSGNSIDRRSGVRHLSSSMLKSYITQAAECTIQTGGVYHDYYRRLRDRGKVHGVAINNVKNKLIQLAFTLVKSNSYYEKEHEMMRSIRNLGVTA